MNIYAITLHGRFTGDYVCADTRHEAIARYRREQGEFVLPIHAERVN